MVEIYLDNAATTKVDNEVIREMLPYYYENYGNASSQHGLGYNARKALEKARKIIAKSIGAKEYEIIFTSGGTESNNLALKGLYSANMEKGKKHIITTKIEHDCVLKTCEWLEKYGAEVTYLDVDAEGFINLDKLRENIREDTLVVSIIHGNNEIGTIQDLEEIGKICKEKEVYFHTDACQSYTKIDIDVKKQNLGLVTLNAHKIHGPKGVGALFIREDIKIHPMQHGGGHERNLRSGTENIPGIVGFAGAVKMANRKDTERMEELIDYFIDELLKIEGVRLNGPRKDRLCNNINVSFGNIEGEAIGGDLENYEIYTSTGSACMSHSLESSHVLKAIGLAPLESNSSLRLSLSKYTTKEEIDKTLGILKNTVDRLRKLSPIKLSS